jgi:sulfur-carrier protein adenylyltransferase/sulfurtransferase
MKEITVVDLKVMMENKEDFQLIDVREPHEYEISNLGGQLIPLSEIPNSIDKIDRTKKVIIHCRSGARSGQAVQWLEKNHGFTNLINLQGGILAWSNQVDPSLPKY